MPRPQASARYEQAIDAGDLPVLVEQSTPGLYTASLGNLQPGDEAVIELNTPSCCASSRGACG